jgi:hypothetical protein
MTYKFCRHGNNIRAYVDGDRHNLAWADFDLDGNMVSVCEESFIMHWDHSDDKMLSDKIKSFAPAPFDCPVYIRFNRLPRGGKSKNFATGSLENGVSVYEAQYDLVSGEYKICGSGLAGALIAYTIKNAPIYFVTGREAGRGSDGEPVLENVKVLAKAKRENDGYVVME